MTATKDELKKQIGVLVSEYLGFNTNLAFGHHDKPELENALAKMTQVVELSREAKTLQAKYTRDQWDIAILFGSDNNTILSDITKTNRLLRQANDLWCSNLWSQ